MDRREKILAALDTTVANFLYYDRKEDEDLPRGEIEEALANGETSIGELVTWFEVALRQSI